MWKKFIVTGIASIPTPSQGMVVESTKPRNIKKHLIAIGLSLSLVFGEAIGANMKLIRQEEIKLPYQIFSNPVMLRSQQSSAMSVALVVAETVGDYDKFTSVDAYQLNGKRMAGFPIMRQKGPGYKVAPANQLLAADADNDGIDELVVMDMDGSPHFIRQNGSELSVQAGTNPSQGVLACPPTRLVLSAKSYLLLLSTDVRPITKSIPGLNLINYSGQPSSGYPVKLPGAVENNSPVVLSNEGKVFVLLNSGQVDGYSLLTGEHLAGFPTASIGESVPSGIRQMVYLSSSNKILVSSVNNFLASIDPPTGKLEKLPVKGAQKLTRLASSEGKVYAFDDGLGILFSLDAQGNPVGHLKLDVPAGSKLSSLQAMPSTLAGGTAVFLVLSGSSSGGSDMDALYQEHAPEEYTRKIEKYAMEDAVAEYGAYNPANTAQVKLYNTRLREMKEGFLEDKFGTMRLADMKFGEPSTQIVAVIDEGGSMGVAFNDKVGGFTPETGALHSPKVDPAYYMDTGSNMLVYVVPLNHEKGGDKETTSAVLRIYQIQL